MYGVKTMNPTITDTKAQTNTAAADKSFTFLIIRCFSGETKSDRFSIAEFSNSEDITKPIDSIRKIHSCEVILKMTPAIVTNIVIEICILELCSSFNKIFRPLKAYVKLLNLFFIENLFFSIISFVL